MSLTETLKNTIELLNDIYEKDSGFRFESGSVLTWNFLKDGLNYILSFQWANDFVKLPIFLPHESQSILADQIFSPNLSFLPSENGHDSFITGFLNCFFLYFPLAPVQFIWLRRVIIDGPWAGVAATIGIIIGNLSLIGFCLFGFRDVLNIWFFSLWEPLSYFLGIWLIFIVIFQMTQKPLKILKKSQKKELFMICVMNFALVWTDQPGVYQFFGNLALHTGIYPLDISEPVPYFCGIILGSVLWAPFIGFLVVQIGYFFPRITKYPYSVWIRGFNLFCLIGCSTLALTSLPYYGFDYLFANPLGFVPQDQSWNGFLELKTETGDANKGRLGEKSSYSSVDTDLSLFDRGSYGGGPVVELNIESLNYKKEYAWRSRFDRLSSRYLNLTRGGGLLAKYLLDQDQDFETPKPVVAALSEAESQTPDSGKNEKIFQEEEEFSDSDSDSDVALSEADAMSYEEAEEAEDFIERFIENYTAEANTEDTEIPDLPDEEMIKFSAFSEIAKYGFDFFSMFEAIEVDPLDQQLAAELKEKYSANFLYRFLVHFDISNFLQRQPSRNTLKSTDEIALFENRLALGEYYNTLRSYSHLDLDVDIDLPERATFSRLFCGPKSYVNRIYNQQFKGTLKIVERLFSIHLEDEQNIPKLPEWDMATTTSTSSVGSSREPSILKFDQPLYKTDFHNALVHEQFLEKKLPEVQEIAPSPFFAGWDNEQRKFLITNRLLTRQSSPLLKSEDISFTTWPVTEEVLRNSPELSRLFRTREESPPSTDDLFKYAEPLMEEDTVIYEKLPNIIQRVELKNTEKLQTSLAPTRGGFIWAGNEPLKFKFQFFQKISSWFPKAQTPTKPSKPPTVQR